MKRISLAAVLAVGMLMFAPSANACDFLSGLFQRPGQCQQSTKQGCKIRSFGGGCCGQPTESRPVPCNANRVPQSAQLIFADSAPRQTVRHTFAVGSEVVTIEGSADAVAAYLQANGVASQTASQATAAPVFVTPVPVAPPVGVDEVRSGLHTVPGPVVSTAPCVGGNCPNRPVAVGFQDVRIKR